MTRASALEGHAAAAGARGGVPGYGLLPAPVYPAPSCTARLRADRTGGQFGVPKAALQKGLQNCLPTCS
jgi:hypothetical protein